MRPHRLLLLIFFLCAAPHAIAEALPLNGGERCLSANIDSQPASTGAYLYRIVFLNRCDAPRSFMWCAEHPAAALPPGIACPKAPGALASSVELRHHIRQRKEFQWHLPPGVRIRHQDCPDGELPTVEFSCAAPAPLGAARR